MGEAMGFRLGYALYQWWDFSQVTSLPNFSFLFFKKGLLTREGLLTGVTRRLS